MKDVEILGGAFFLAIFLLVCAALVLAPLVLYGIHRRLGVLYGIYRRLGEIRDLLERGAAVAPRVAPSVPREPPAPQPLRVPQSEEARPTAPARPSDAAAMIPRGFIAQATGEALPPEPEPEAESQGWKADRIYAIVVGGIVLAGVLITLWLVSK